MILTLVLMTVITIGIIAMLLGEPRDVRSYTVWSDDIERQLLRDRKIDNGW